MKKVTNPRTQRAITKLNLHVKRLKQRKRDLQSMLKDYQHWIVLDLEKISMLRQKDFERWSKNDPQSFAEFLGADRD